MSVTDIHSHLYHADWYPQLFQERLTIQHLRRRNRPVTNDVITREIKTLNRVLSDKDGSTCLKIMDKASIDKRVIHVIDWGLELGEPACSIAEINEAILNVCRRHSDRLIGFAGIDPRRPDAVPLLIKMFDDFGAKGLKLHPTSQGWTLHDDHTAALLELAAQRDLPVMVHIGGTISPLCDDHCQPEDILRACTSFPNVNFIAGHSGFTNWRAFGANPPRNLCFDISAWQEGIAKNEVGLKAEIQQLVAAYPGRVFFGTDSPFYGFNMAFSDAKFIATVREAVEPLGAEAMQPVFSGGILQSRATKLNANGNQH